MISEDNLGDTNKPCSPLHEVDCLFLELQNGGEG